MALKKDKEKVLDEVMDETQLKSFLDIRPPQDVNADYNILERAYRGMNADYFAALLKLFIAEGRDINSANPDGKSILAVISEHTPSADYLAALKEFGASS